jgi:hypothetical protein
MLDFTLVLVATLTTPILIRWIQNRPIEGPFAIIDLILPQQDPRDRLLHLCLLFVMPFSIGVLIGLVASNKIVVAAAGVGLGALMSVSAAFFRPDTLAPPLRQKLRTAQLVYGLFVLGCAVLSVIGATASDLVLVIWRNENIREGIIANFVAATVIAALSQIAIRLAIRPLSKLVARIDIASAGSRNLPVKEKELRELVREIVTSELKSRGGDSKFGEAAPGSEKDAENQQ